MFASADLLAQNRKLANAQKLIRNRNRMVQLAELGKKQNPVKCDSRNHIMALKVAKIRLSLEFALILHRTMNIQISDDELSKNISEQLGTLGQEVYENIDNALGNFYHLESAINSVDNFLKASFEFKQKEIDNFKALKKIEEDTYNDIDFDDLNSVRVKVMIWQGFTVKKKRAEQAIQVAEFIQKGAEAIYEILSPLSKNIAGGRRTRRNRKNNRNTRRNKRRN